MKANDALIGTVALLFGSAVALYARTFPALAGMPVGPGLFPSIIGGAMAVCGLILIGREVVARRRGAGGPAVVLAGWAAEPRAWFRAAAVLAALVFYIAASRALGFHVTASLIVAGLMVAFGVRVLVALPAAVLAAVAIHFIFYSLLRVSLPWGVLLPIAW